MASVAKKRLYRITFNNQGKIYEIFARKVFQGGMLGLVEIEDIVFEKKFSVIVDPAEDALKKEFENTKRFFIPIHSIIRIDELEKESDLKPRIVPLNQKNGEGEKSEPATFSPIIRPPDKGR